MANVSLIVTIVRKGWGDKVLEGSMKAGAEGGTILMGRGVGVHETHQSILGIPIEPEKEIVLSVTYPEKTEAILRKIVDSCDLEDPGAGIAFVIPVEKVVGVCHQLGTQHDISDR
ncbi:MAG: P-II family nitrogen regulator [Dehalococcoides mccartyi]|uniref:P-II family nitrogen regulator n=1 Tax=Dehalococcoides mccartyi TaxID=61435 RepID=UPI0030F6EB02